MLQAKLELLKLRPKELEEEECTKPPGAPPNEVCAVRTPQIPESREKAFKDQRETQRTRSASPVVANRATARLERSSCPNVTIHRTKSADSPASPVLRSCLRSVQGPSAAARLRRVSAELAAEELCVYGGYELEALVPGARAFLDGIGGKCIGWEIDQVARPCSLSLLRVCLHGLLPFSQPGPARGCSAHASPSSCASSLDALFSLQGRLLVDRNEREESKRRRSAREEMRVAFLRDPMRPPRPPRPPRSPRVLAQCWSNSSSAYRALCRDCDSAAPGASWEEPYFSARSASRHLQILPPSASPPTTRSRSAARHPPPPCLARSCS